MAPQANVKMSKITFVITKQSKRNCLHLSLSGPDFFWLIAEISFHFQRIRSLGLGPTLGSLYNIYPIKGRMATVRLLYYSNLTIFIIRTSLICFHRIERLFWRWIDEKEAIALVELLGPLKKGPKRAIHHCFTRRFIFSWPNPRNFWIGRTGRPSPTDFSSPQ